MLLILTAVGMLVTDYGSGLVHLVAQEAHYLSMVTEGD